ncbi:uncharacterized protein [Dysidea avara]|uniref:uncharacterized protein n=1 Tax=Dysidea avara TaxID=196820 RepID=UPI00331A8C0D
MLVVPSIRYSQLPRFQCSSLQAVRQLRQLQKAAVASLPTTLHRFSDPDVVDLRSDTLTHPTMQMRQAILNAPVGDDCYKEDPSVNLLQDTVAKLFGKEAALLFPTGVMANLVAMMVLCDSRTSEVLIGEFSHQMIYENGGLATLANVNPRILRNLADGTFDLEEVASKIRGNYAYEPTTKAICVENTQNYIGGRVIRPSFMKKLHSITSQHGVKIYVDGARIMNAAVALGIPPGDLLEYADVAAIGVAKGLAAPLGALLVGSTEFITNAYKIRKLLGGGMRQAGIIAAPALVALDTMPALLQRDHKHAKMLATKLAELVPLGLNIDMDAVETNMVMFTVEGLSVKEMIRLMAEPTDKDGGQYIIKLFDNGNTVRAVMHYHISAEDINKTVAKAGAVLRNLPHNNTPELQQQHDIM